MALTGSNCKWRAAISARYWGIQPCGKYLLKQHADLLRELEQISKDVCAGEQASAVTSKEAPDPDIPQFCRAGRSTSIAGLKLGSLAFYACIDHTRDRIASEPWNFFGGSIEKSFPFRKRV